MALTQAVEMITDALPHAIADGIYPEFMFVGADGVVSTSDSVALATVPVGTTLLYSTSTDRTQFAVTLIGPTFGAIAVFDSVIGRVHFG